MVVRDPEGGGSQESDLRIPIQNLAADTDTTLDFELLLAPTMKMRFGDRPGSTCRTSNRMVLGQRLPSIAIVFHAPASKECCSNFAGGEFLPQRSLVLVPRL